MYVPIQLSIEILMSDRKKLQQNRQRTNLVTHMYNRLITCTQSQKQQQHTIYGLRLCALQAMIVDT